MVVSTVGLPRVFSEPECSALGFGGKDYRTAGVSRKATPASRHHTTAYFAPRSCERAQERKTARVEIRSKHFRPFREASKAQATFRAKCASLRAGLRVSASATSGAGNSPPSPLKTLT
eukprot:1497551-Pyramimonas_sp.AAC.1